MRPSHQYPLPSHVTLLVGYRSQPCNYSSCVASPCHCRTVYMQMGTFAPIAFESTLMHERSAVSQQCIATVTLGFCPKPFRD